MPTNITAHWDSRDVRVLLGALAPRQWLFATAVALTHTGQRVKAAEIAAMPSAFDRPTRWTLNALRLENATVAQQYARVWFKEPSSVQERQHYLVPQVEGGVRPYKRFEGALYRQGVTAAGRQLAPASGAQRDSYGNVSHGVYMQVLSQLHAQRDSKNNETERSRHRKRKQPFGRFFYGNPGGRGKGVWERLRGGPAFGGRRIRPIFLEQRPPSYRPRFAFFDIAERVVAKHFHAEFESAAEQTLKTAR